jgi:hypothetical protein
MENKKPKLPDQAMGKFYIVAGCAMVIIPIFASRMDMGQRISAAGMGFMGLSWGLKQVAAAKKWRQEYGEPSPEEQMEIKQSHSVSNLPILLGYLVLGIVLLAFAGLVFVSIFHYQGVQLVHPNPPLIHYYPTMPTSTNAWQLRPTENL